MELFELKEQIEDTNIDIEYYKKEIERLETKVGIKASDPSKEIVKGGRFSREDALIQLAQISSYLDDALKRLSNLNTAKDKKYELYRKANDYDRQIYIEKRLFKWSNAKISLKHNGIGKSQIYRIIEKFEPKSNYGKKGES